MADKRRGGSSKDIRNVTTSSGDDITIRKNIMPVSKMNEVIQRMMRSIRSIPLVSDLGNKDKLDEFEQRINDVLDKETERFVSSDSGANGKDIAMFINSVLTAKSKDGAGGIPGSIGQLLQNRNITELMNDQSAQINIVLSERYKNLNSLYEDIRLITEQLTELSEVIDTMRDTITNSDNIISDISRSLSFGTKSSEGDSDIETVVAMETATKIKDKLKKIIIPETLKYGNFFVFTQPYSELFAKFKAMDDKFKAGGFGAGVRAAIRVGEAWVPSEHQDIVEEVGAFFDEYSKDIIRAHDGDTKKFNGGYTKEAFIAEMNEYLDENISVVNDADVPLMEDSNISGLAYADIRDSVVKAMRHKPKTGQNWSSMGGQKSDNKYADGVLGSHTGNLSKAEDMYKQEFKDIRGVYMKLYDPRRVIPVYVMDFCIGYYVLYETMQHTTTNVLNAVHTLSRTTMLFQNDRKKEFENKIVALISDRICKQIDKPFLQKNADFKELIANAISFDEFYTKNFRVQFVTSNYMTHFKVNEDYNTHMGVSVLRRSIFYAMLYLTLLLFKIIMICTRSSDTRMFMIHTMGEDKDISGRINKVVADFKQNQISYNDFGSVRGVLSKVGKGRDVAIPIGPNGERAFDVEVMQGQQYDLDTPLMELLRKGMISNTGCPSAMINFLDEVDYARQIAMMHTKYVSRMVSMQEETEGPITELYKKLLTYGNYEINPDKLDNFKFNWSRPKTLSMSNITEMIGTTEQITEFMSKIFIGDNTKEDPRLKDRYFKYMVTKVIMPGVFDWESIESDLKKEFLALHQSLKEDDIKAPQEGGQM